jgi:uncharacterized protein (DUF488 family)
VIINRLYFSTVRRKHPPSQNVSFFTLGYQSHSVRSFLGILSANKVRVLVDVRQNPVSRKPGFSKGCLEKSVHAYGIEYVHLPCLGTPLRIRQIYARTGNVQGALQQYERHLRSKKQCLESLLHRVTSQQFCLLCLESDHNSCHRSVIAQQLTEMTGCQPIHLR